MSTTSTSEVLLVETKVKVYRLKKHKQDWTSKGKMTLEMTQDARTGSVLVTLREKSLQHCIYGKIPRCKGTLSTPNFGKDTRTAILPLKYTTSNHRKTKPEADVFCLKFFNNAEFDGFRQGIDKGSTWARKSVTGSVLSPISTNAKTTTALSTGKLNGSTAANLGAKVPVGVLVPVSMNSKYDDEPDEKKRKIWDSAGGEPPAKRRKQNNEELRSSSSLAMAAAVEENDVDDFEDNGFDFGESQDPFDESYLVTYL